MPIQEITRPTAQCPEAKRKRSETMMARIIDTMLRRHVLGVLLASLAATHANAAAIWTNASNSAGLWKEAVNWSTGIAPHVGTGSTYITNRNNKTVAISVDTPLTNLVVGGSLNVWAPADFTNTLLLQDLGPNPFVVSNTSVLVNNRGVLRVTNSSLVITGRFIRLELSAGEVILDSGSIVAREVPPTNIVNVFTRIGTTNVATLTIHGGRMEVSALLISEQRTSVGRAEGTMRMSGGELVVHGEFNVGRSLQRTGVVEMTGGRLVVVNNLTNIMRIGDDGIGTMIVSNATASVGNVSVARHDQALGTLVLHDFGAFDATDDISIGRFGGATGLVFVAGGRLSASNQTVWVGREGVGELVVSNGLVAADAMHVAVPPTNGSRGSVLLAGGLTKLSDHFLLGDGTISTGQVLVAGGNLLVTNRDHDARLEIASGTLTLSNGTVVADQIVVTNNSASLRFAGGMLTSRATVVSNGAPFVVGDGVTPATFFLDGGTHVFSGGLAITANATLAGCGTVIGNIIMDGGTNALTECASQPVITHAGFTESTFVLSVFAESGSNYFLEYKNLLTDPAWTTLTNRVGGDALLMLVDPSPPSPTRFYRLRLE